jgi:hypothetical protein
LLLSPPNQTNMTFTGPGGFPPDNGFIAVFDGDLNLRWTYHYFEENQNAVTTITDLSIRVELDQTGQLREFVTYCGATRNGNVQPPTALTTMAPSAGVECGPFLAPPSMGDVYAAGDSDNGQYTQWDGIVGRVSHPFSVPAGGAVPRFDFHSIVGGSGDDALLGIAQKSLGAFVVVGVTQGTPPGALAFPLTDPLTWDDGSASSVQVTFSQLAPPWTFGVALQFTAPTPALPLTNLQLESSRLIGSPQSRTVARDVSWQEAPGLDWIYVVGSTDYPDLGLQFPSQSVGTFGGTSSGFLVVTPILLAPWQSGRYVNGASGFRVGSGHSLWIEI